MGEKLMNRTLLAVIGAVVVIAGIAIAWYLISPLFIDRTVDEAFPFNCPARPKPAR